MTSCGKQLEVLLRLGLFVAFPVLTAGGCMGHSEPRPEARSDRRESASSDEPPLFVDITDEAGIDFRHEVESRGSFHLAEIVGSGFAVIDYDLDGDLDIYFVNAGGLPREPAGDTPAASRNQFYEQTERGRFEDVTVETGLAISSLGTGVAVGDVNNDGYPDLYVSSYAGDRLFLNQRDKTFVDVTLAAGIENPRFGLSACFFDFDRDGWLDLYVTNYVVFTDRPCTRPGGGDRDYCSPKGFPPAGDKLFRNVTAAAVEQDGANGLVRFRDVSISSNISSQRGPGMGVTTIDINGDSWQDIYVANDQTANFAWINQKDGRFEEEAVLRGCAYDAMGRAQASMGIAAADVDGDQKFELLLGHIDSEQNTLYRGTDGGAFDNATGPTGIGALSRPYTSFGTALVDLDHDGDLDAAMANGNVRQASVPRSAAEFARLAPELHMFWSPYAQQNLLLMNEDGEFVAYGSDTDPFVRHLGVSRSMAVADIDNDGDMDLLLSNIADRARVYRNDAQKRGNWLLVRAVDPARGSRDDYGAVITVCRAKSRWVRLVQPASSYLASNDPRAHFGLGPAETCDRIEVAWSDGTSETFQGGETNRAIVLEKGTGRDDKSSR